MQQFLKCGNVSAKNNRTKNYNKVTVKNLTIKQDSAI